MNYYYLDGPQCFWKYQSDLSLRIRFDGSPAVPAGLWWVHFLHVQRGSRGWGLQRGSGLGGVKNDTQLISLRRRPISLCCEAGIEPRLSWTAAGGSRPFAFLRHVDGGREWSSECVRACVYICVCEATYRWVGGGEEETKGKRERKKMKVLTAYPHLFI